MLAAVLLPCHRTAKLHGGRGNDGLLGIEWRLGAEPAAHERGDDSDRFEIAVEEICERRPAQMRRLRRRPHAQHIGAHIMAGEHGARLERRMKEVKKLGAWD